MKNYKNFINEHKGVNKLRFSIFDWDDNLLMLGTPIHFEHKVNGEWIPEDISPKEFVDLKEKFPQYWDNDDWRCDFDTAFLEFRDNGPRGTNAFLEDTKKALELKDYGPSWNDFIRTLISGELFAIVTTRGHEPDTLRKSVEYIIYNELKQRDHDKMLNNLMKYHDAFDKDFDYLIDDYLNNCIFIGIMSESFKNTIGNKASSKNVAKAKEQAVKYVIDKFSKYGKMIDVPTKIGFSDDDKDYYNSVKNLFIGNNELFDNIDFYVFDTSDSNLEGGKKLKV